MKKALLALSDPSDNQKTLKKIAKATQDKSQQENVLIWAQMNIPIKSCYEVDMYFPIGQDFLWLVHRILAEAKKADINEISVIASSLNVRDKIRKLLKVACQDNISIVIYIEKEIEIEFVRC